MNKTIRIWRDRMTLLTPNHPKQLRKNIMKKKVWEKMLRIQKKYKPKLK